MKQLEDRQGPGSAVQRLGGWIVVFTSCLSPGLAEETRAEKNGEWGLQGSGEVLETFFSELWETQAFYSDGEKVSIQGESERAEGTRGESRRWSRFAGAKGRSVRVQPWWEKKLTGWWLCLSPLLVDRGWEKGTPR